MLRANPFEIREGGNRLWRLSRDIKPQYPSIVLRLGMRLGMLSYFPAGHFCSLFGLLAGCWAWHRPDGSTPWRFDPFRLPPRVVFLRVSPSPSLLSRLQTPHASPQSWLPALDSFALDYAPSVRSPGDAARLRLFPWPPARSAPM